MRAVACPDGCLDVIDLPDPEPAEGQVLLEVTGCGICGSDLHARHHADAQADVLAEAGYDGFARTHRRFLVRVTAVTEARWESGHLTVLVNGMPIPVARRHTREVRERLNHR